MKASQSSIASGLSTSLHKVVSPGVYSLSAQTTVIQPSGLVVTLSQTGSTSASIVTPATSPLQESISVQKSFNCASGDLLSVVVSSSANADQPPNLIKTTIVLKQGI